MVPHDPVHEAVVIGACALDRQIRDVYVVKLYADHFLAREHADAWGALIELKRRGLDYDPATVESIAGEKVARTIESIIESRPEVPNNLAYHVDQLMWDRVKASVIQGPHQAFLEVLKDPVASADRSKVRSLARQLASAFDGYEERQWIHDPKQLVHEQMREIEKRVDGHAAYPYGIEGLDYFSDQRDEDGEPARRMIPGAAPGQITCISAVSGGGKSTVTANIALGLARLGRRVLWGAWEMKGGMNLELLACISLGWSRADLIKGKGPIRSHEGRVELEERMHALSEYVTFMKNPFRRRIGEKPSNERNLDLLHGILSDAACDVFIADLWKRCLHVDQPSEEEEALIRQQMMAEDLGQHHILLQQQRLKDIEQRPDKRPTREGTKGSSAWVEVPDTYIGVHWPALWKNVPRNKIEVLILKQRYGEWPLAIEFDWQPDYGRLDGGVSIAYQRPGEGSEIDSFSAAGAFLGQKGGKKGRR